MIPARKSGGLCGNGAIDELTRDAAAVGTAVAVVRTATAVAVTI